MSVVKLKFLYKKDFVKAFKDKCKSESPPINQTDFIKQAMADFILKSIKGN